MKRIKENNIYTKPAMSTVVFDFEEVLCASVDIIVDEYEVEDETEFEL